MQKTSDIVKLLDLDPHPEDGFYKRLFEAKEVISTEAGERPITTSIIYLLPTESYSGWHRIRSHELWFFHEGNPVHICSIVDNQIVTNIIGMTPTAMPRCEVKPDTWFAARSRGSANYSLVSCVVSPGFDFNDFELADDSVLAMLSPEDRDLAGPLLRR